MGNLSIPVKKSPLYRLKIPHPEAHEWASLASDAVEPSAVLWRVLGETEPEAKERAAASTPCPSRRYQAGHFAQLAIHG